SPAFLYFSEDYVIQEGFPAGDFCEGYPNVSDGYYYEFVAHESMKKYAHFDNEEDVKIVAPEIPKKYSASKILKVMMVIGEFHSVDLYFLENSGKWILWVLDECDCSA